MSEVVRPLHATVSVADPAQSADASNRLPISTFVAYGLPRFAMGLVGVVVTIYFVNFGTDVLLISPIVMGLIHTSARLWDGVTDPLAGYLSDRTRSRFGRRRSWLYAAALPMGLAVIVMWSPPAGLDAFWIVVWVFAAYILYETVQDVFLIPHGALGVELSQNYHERTRVFAWQHLFLALGTLFGLAALFYVQAGDPRERVQVFAVVGGALLCATILYAAWKLPERASYQGRGPTNPLDAFRDVLRNPHARPLLGMYAVETLGVGSIGALTPFMAQYVYGDAGLTTSLAGAYLLPQALLTPLWIALAHRIDKKQIWLAAMVVTCCGFFVQTFLTADMRGLILGIPFVLGVAAGVGQVCAPAIQADIIDYDEYLTGERKEGAYLAVWNFVRKCSGALTPVLAFVSLQLAGYRPNVEQNELTQWVMRGFFGVFPALCFVVGIFIFLRFRFSHREHAAIRRALDARR
jgi:GPH family glycoside/pentoside/hexuronide:cation symporter